jgi:hypothetical protein
MAHFVAKLRPWCNDHGSKKLCRDDIALDWNMHSERLRAARRRADSRNSGIVDVLSEVLRVVRLCAAIHFRAEFTHPWAILSTLPAMLAAGLKVPEGSVTPFHVVTRGCRLVTSGELPPIQVETGGHRPA